MSDTLKSISSPQRPATWRFRWVRQSHMEVCCPYCDTWVLADSETVTQGMYSSVFAQCPKDGRITVSLEDNLQGPDVGIP